MSGALTVLSAVGSNTALRSIVSSTGILPSSLQSLLLGVQRSFGNKISGTIIPDVAIEETHSDRLTVTQHPISTGTPVSDHVYRQPAQVTMRCGWTNANPIGAVASGFSSGGGFSNLAGGLSGAASGLWQSFTEQRVTTVYEQLRKMQFNVDAASNQAAVNVITVTTGKRTYPNMVITEISVRTDRTSEYSLFVEAHFQEVITVTTQTTTQPAQTDQSNPSQTASPTDNGTQSPTPKEPNFEDTPSYIKQGVQGIGAALNPPK